MKVQCLKEAGENDESLVPNRISTFIILLERAGLLGRGWIAILVAFK